MKKCIFLALFLINFCLSIFSQNIECIGNNIQIPLIGYKFGVIQWQFSTDNSNWLNVSNQTSQNLQTTITETGYFRAKISYGKCDYYSDTTFIQAYPKPTTANAGIDQIKTNYDTLVTLTANTPVYGKGKWIIVSGVGGSFVNDTITTTTFIGKPCTNYQLRWTISTACNSNYDDVSIRFNATPTASNAGNDQIKTNLDTMATLTANTPVYGKGKWTIISGLGGSFVNDTIATTTFIGKSCTNYQLRWTISTACNSSYDEVVIQFNATPSVANAVKDGIFDNGDTIINLLANNPIIGKGYWTILSGKGGIIIDSLNPKSTFKGIRFNSYKLRWNIVTNCSISYDDVEVDGDIYDIDGNVYNTVTIGTQVWMAENHKAMHYSNGTDIPLVNSNATWDALTAISKAYCWYNDDIANKDVYGALYTWAAAMNGAISTINNPSGIQGVCPTGWHLPSDAEWTQMENYLANNGYNYDGTTGGGGAKIGKSLASKSGWSNSSNTGAVGNTDYPIYRNKSGFTALTGGYRGNDGHFDLVGYGTYWWSATEYGTDYAWYQLLYYVDRGIGRNGSPKELGFSVRCVRD